MRKVLGILAGSILLMVLFQNCQKSDFIVVSGTVTDSLTNEPIQGAYIFTTDGHVFMTADDGTFSMEGIQPGKINFRVFSFSGYHQKSKSVIISSGRVTKVDFSISPIDNPKIETGRVTAITLHSATVTGNLKWNPEINVTQYGHCWAYSTSFPSLEESVGHTTFGGGNGDITYSSYLSGLQTDNIYYVRAYVRTSTGEVLYGNSVAFKTAENEITDGLIAFYPFSNTFTDQSGIGVNLASYGWSNAPFTNDRFGNSNSALRCESPIYTYGYSEVFNELTQFSISFWFNKTNWAGSDKPMINTGYSNYTNEIRIGEDASTNKLYFDIKTGSGTKYKVGATSEPQLNRWHHVVALRNNNSIQLYIDGTLQGNTNCDSSPIGNNNFLFVGFDIVPSIWNWNYFTGSLDDIKVYDRALTNSEIQFLYSH